jgi:hypothetical protein
LFVDFENCRFLHLEHSRAKDGVGASGAYPAQPTLTEAYERLLGGLDCGCDGELLATLTGGSLSLEQTTRKDPAGRGWTYYKDHAGLESEVTFQLGGRQRTVVQPDGGQRVQIKYRNGLLKSVTGSGTVEQHHTYGVNADGTIWSRLTQGSATGARQQTVTRNHLGQIIRSETPAYDGGVVVVSFAYNPAGQVARQRMRHVSGATETAVQADTLMGYDALGQLTRFGFDVDGDKPKGSGRCLLIFDCILGLA